jgi:mono/diheme cytochrome c family protein
MQLPLVFTQSPDFHYVLGRWDQAAAIKLSSESSKIWGALIAWDPVQQREVWRVPQPEMWNGGALSTASDLVFAGNAHGEFNAYRGQDGTKLWSFKQPAAIMAGPVSFSVDGEQYVAVLAGAGGAGPLALRDANRPQQTQPMGRVLAFKLGGTASLPTSDLTPAPANPPQETFPPEEVKAGAGLFFGNCVVCHGGSVLPDLRRSAALSDQGAWNQIVIGGVLSAQGMASFAPWLKPEEIESIRAYVAEDARALQKQTAAK